MSFIINEFYNIPIYTITPFYYFSSFDERIFSSKISLVLSFTLNDISNILLYTVIPFYYFLSSDSTLLYFIDIIVIFSYQYLTYQFIIIFSIIFTFFALLNDWYILKIFNKILFPDWSIKESYWESFLWTFYKLTYPVFSWFHSSIHEFKDDHVILLLRDFFSQLFFLFVKIIYNHIKQWFKNFQEWYMEALPYDFVWNPGTDDEEKFNINRENLIFFSHLVSIRHRLRDWDPYLRIVLAMLYLIPLYWKTIMWCKNEGNRWMLIPYQGDFIDFVTVYIGLIFVFIWIVLAVFFFKNFFKIIIRKYTSYFFQILDLAFFDLWMFTFDCYGLIALFLIWVFDGQIVFILFIASFFCFSVIFHTIDFFYFTQIKDTLLYILKRYVRRLVRLNKKKLYNLNIFKADYINLFYLLKYKSNFWQFLFKYKYKWSVFYIKYRIKKTIRIQRIFIPLIIFIEKN